MLKARFISFEGGEGVGKTTLIGQLLQKLKSCDISAIATREPGGTPSAEAIRDVFMSHSATDRLVPMAEFMLASAGRAQHVAQKIKINLDSHTWVLTDRFFDSSLVYQGILGGVDLKFIHSVNIEVCKNLEPDLTILIDLDPIVALKRVEKRKNTLFETSHYDVQDFECYKKIADGFKEIAKQNPQRFFVLDGDNKSEFLTDKIFSEIKRRGFL